jgi:arginase
VQPIIVPYHLTSVGSGMGAGPEALLRGGALDGIDTAPPTTLIVERLPPDEPNACFAIDAALATLLQRVARQQVPVVFAGNCHTAVGTIAGVHPDAVIWFDAHGDLNTPDTTRSGFFDGMALAAVLGRAWRSSTADVPRFEPIADSSVLLVGGRDLDPPEQDVLNAAGIPWHRPASCRCDAHTDAALRTALAALGGTRRIYLHVDLDILDPTELRANRYACGGGVSVEWLEAAVRTVAAQHEIAAIAFTAFDPESDSAIRAAAIVGRLLRAL